MASRLLLMLRHPWKTLAFSWMSIRFLILAIADRLLFPFACRPVSLYTEITRCLLGSSLACFLELTFSAPPGLRADEYRPVELNNVSTIVVPRETKLESLGSAETPRTLVLLYAHGGGYLFGEPLMYMDSYKRWIKEAESVGIRLVVVSVDYRLTTSAKFPAYRDDFITVYQALLDMAISSRNIFFAGDSAGGNLCAISAIYARNTGMLQPAGLILLSPWLDLTHSQTLHSPAMKTDFLVTFPIANPMLVESLLPEDMDASDPRISPVFDKLNSLPPQIVFVGGAEVLIPDSREWVRRSREAGNSVDYVEEWGQVHMYTMGRPFCTKAIETKTDKLLISFVRHTSSVIGVKTD